MKKYFVQKYSDMKIGEFRPINGSGNFVIRIGFSQWLVVDGYGKTLKVIG